jgi:hypothetical protein
VGVEPGCRFEGRRVEQGCLRLDDDLFADLSDFEGDGKVNCSPTPSVMWSRTTVLYPDICTLTA